MLVRHRFKLFAGFFLLNATIQLYIYIFIATECRDENFSLTLVNIRNELRLPSPEQMLIGCSFHKSQT